MATAAIKVKQVKPPRERRFSWPLLFLLKDGSVMYVTPGVTAFGRIELQTSRSSELRAEVDETTTPSAGGAGVGIGLNGLTGGAAVVASRDNDQSVAAVADEEERKHGQK